MAEQEVTNSQCEEKGNRSDGSPHNNSQRSTDNEDWRKGKKALQRVAYLLEKGLWCDCGFYVQGGEEPPQTFRCHKVILAGASPYFEAQFFGLVKEEGDIKVPDISPSAFKIMIHYIYKEELPEISFDQILRVGVAANKYLVDELLQQCLKKMGELLKSENAIQAFEFAQITNCEWLEKDALRVMQNETVNVLKSEFVSEALQSTLETLLRSNVLNVKSEVVLWETIVDWGKRRCGDKGVTPDSKELRRVLEPLLPHFRFLALSSEEFAEGPAMSGILTKDECLNIFVCIASRKIPFTLSNRFSSIRNKRVVGNMFDIEETCVDTNKVQVCFKSYDFVQVKGFEFSKSTFAEKHAYVQLRSGDAFSTQWELTLKTSQEGYKYVMLQNSIYLQAFQDRILIFLFHSNNRVLQNQTLFGSQNQSSFASQNQMGIDVSSKKHFMKNSKYIHSVLV